jgi:hypothetical protein
MRQMLGNFRGGGEHQQVGRRKHGNRFNWRSLARACARSVGNCLTSVTSVTKPPSGELERAW